MRRVSSAQSSPIARWMSCATPAKTGGGITICQIRVMFSRSSSPIKGNNHAITSGKRSCGTVLDITPTALPCSGIGTRCLQGVARRHSSVQGVECRIEAPVISLVRPGDQGRDGFKRGEDGQFLAVGVPDQYFIEESEALDGRRELCFAAG
jgi:hypothetical protein